VIWDGGGIEEIIEGMIEGQIEVRIVARTKGGRLLDKVQATCHYNKLGKI
jgi:hypothetical protein